MIEREIFAAALEQPTDAARIAFLDEACADDQEMRRRIDLLLMERSSLGSFMEHPAVESVPTELLRGSTDGPCRTSNESRTTPHAGEIPLDFLAPSTVPGSLGRLGQYDILEAVGRGGMGIVLKAQDEKLNRVVAVKVLAPELASNPTARKRFAREAQAAAAISHDHVVTIYAVENGGSSGGNPVSAGIRISQTLPYLVMEFIDGQSLQEKIDRDGPLEVKEILRIGRQAAAGLAAAHAQGLIHRDVKPSNILLQNGVQRVQITDFGLARAVDDVGMTRTGEITGTPQYMSPEQAQGHAVDARSDLFSLGSVLYAMCTGRSPFRADTSVATLRRVSDDTPRPICEVNPDIPDWLVVIIDRLLEKDPRERFQTATEVADLLGKYLAHLQDPGSTEFPRTVRPLRRGGSPRANGHPHRWAVAALVLLALVLTFGVTEATGVTHLAATVVRIVTGEGTLVIEVDDPSVEITIDGEELSVTGAGLQELKLRPGQYQFQASKYGKPIKAELVSITRGDRKVVAIGLESTRPDQLKETPGNWEAWFARGQLYLWQAEWEKAADDFGQAWAFNPHDRLALLAYAAALIKAKKYEMHRQLCEQLLSSRQIEEAQAADEVVKICLLVPGLFDLSELPVDRIDDYLDDYLEDEDTAKKSIGHPSNFCVTRALVSYRAGNMEETLRWVREAEAAQGETPTPHLLVRRLLIEAMALHGQGNAELSCEAFKEAVRQFQRENPFRQVSASRYFTAGWLLADVLRSEASKVLCRAVETDSDGEVKQTESDTPAETSHDEPPAPRPSVDRHKPTDNG